MADNTDSPSFSFGIENTMEMGMGNTELLEGLLGPESATADLEDLQNIEKEIQDPPPAEKPKVVAKEAPKPKAEHEKPDQNLISSFLGGGEDEEEEEPGNQGNQQEQEQEQEQEVSQFTALAKDLFKLGVFSKGDDEEDVVINTPEEFLERFNAEKNKGAIEMVQNFIGQFGEDYQRAFDAIYVKGVDPREYFGTYNNIVSFAELDLENEANQETVVRQGLTDQGFDPEDISTEIERLRSYGDLEAVAQKHHKVLVKREALKLQQLEQKAEQEQKQRAAIREQYMQNVNTVLQEKLKTKEFDGIPINPSLAAELQNFLLVEKYKTATGETLTDFDRTILELKRPENHAMKVKVALLLKILQKDPTLSTIQRSGASKRAETLFSETAKQKTVATSSQKRPSSWFSE